MSCSACNVGKETEDIKKKGGGSVLRIVMPVVQDLCMKSRTTKKCNGIQKCSCFLLADSLTKDFMSAMRSQLPHQSITPKLHLLEDHIVPFIRRWHAGPGYLGEQGGESVHKEFNILAARHASMRHKEVDRLLSAMREQHMQVHPCNVVKAPVPQKRAVKK